MGEIAEAIIEGEICQECLSPFEGEEPLGYPRVCDECKEIDKEIKEDFTK